MSLVWLFKVSFSFTLILVSVLTFQYIGSSKLDFFLIGLTSFIIGLVFFIFYESAIKKNKKLFIILLSLTSVFFLLFSYKKLMVAEDRKIIVDLISKTKSLKENEFLFGKLIIEAKNKKVSDTNKPNDANNQDNSSRTNDEDKKIKEFNDKVNADIRYIKSLIDENIKILSSIHNKQISSNDKIRIEKNLLKYNDIENTIKKKYDDLKKENAKIKDEMKKAEENSALQNKPTSNDVKQKEKSVNVNKVKKK